MLKFAYIFTVVAFVLTANPALAEKESADSSSSFSADFSDFKLPQYDEKGKLMFILYGKNGKTVGVAVVLQNVLIDMVQRDVNIDSVKDFSGLTPYPLDTPNQNVLDFWKLYPHSQAIIWTSSASFDRAANTIKGSEKIMLRSQMIDLDGVGFDTDFASKSMHIRKDVKVVVRTIPKPEKKSPEPRSPLQSPAPAKNLNQNGINHD